MVPAPADEGVSVPVPDYGQDAVTLVELPEASPTAERTPLEVVPDGSKRGAATITVSEAPSFVQFENVERTRDPVAFGEPVDAVLDWLPG